MKTAEFKKIKGFPKYETDGKNVRSIGGKGNLAFKTGTNKYQMFDASGSRKTLTLEQVNELIEVEPKAKKEKPVKTPKKAKEEQPAKDYNKKDVEAILKDGALKKYQKIYKLHLLGLNNSQIGELTGSRAEVVTRDIWLFKTGQKKL